jgi:hypothetical protein
MILLAGCSDPEGYNKPEDGLDAAREFVRAVLDGDFTKAEMYVLEEEEDRQLFNRYREYMKKQPQSERLGLKSATILINKVESPNDSVTIVTYSNSYHKKPTALQVVRKNEDWKVDFSYTFSKDEGSVETMIGQ